jgi:hypothetical protein
MDRLLAYFQYTLYMLSGERNLFNHLGISAIDDGRCQLPKLAQSLLWVQLAACLQIDSATVIAYAKNDLIGQHVDMDGSRFLPVGPQDDDQPVLVRNASLPLYIQFGACWAELAGQFPKHLLDGTNQIQ